MFQIGIGIWLLTVHPHMRGDNYFINHITLFALGTPPHAWGQFYCLFCKFIKFRYTPTCVGTMVIKMGKGPMITVHPHMRGDNTNRTIRNIFNSGTPPHAWGQCGIIFNFDSMRRYTPTCVGTIHFNLCL